MANYVKITQAEMTAAVTSFKRGPDRTSQNPKQEIVYDWSLGARNNVGPKLSVRLYTSVVPIAGEARDCGADAIRVAVVSAPYGAKERLLFTLKRVHRTPGWDVRMKARLVQAWQIMRSGPSCPACGAYMAPRGVKAKDANGKPKKGAKPVRLFWSCTSYTCKGARSAQKVEREGRLRPPKTHDELLASLAEGETPRGRYEAKGK